MKPITIISFVGKWHITKVARSIEDYAQKGGILEIQKPDPGADVCNLSWPDGAGNSCSIHPGLALSNDRLQVDSSTLYAAATNASVPLQKAWVQFGFQSNQVAVHLDFNRLGDGPAGTFIAEADPPEEEHRDRRKSPRWLHWLHWLRRLLHRLDQTRPGERTAA